MDKLRGTGVALVTPFDQDENIDFDGLKRLLQHTADGGVDYFVVQGTTGESVTTTAQEKKEILEFVINNNPKELPIVYGIGSNSTKLALDAIKETEFTGVDAILSVSPYYNKPSQAGIIAHYQKIADISPVPVILYNVPGRTSSNLTASTTLTLAQHPNIIGVKEASGDVEQAMHIATDKPDNFLIISGDDMLTLPLISVGAVGVISVLANAFPNNFRKSVYDALNGDFNSAIGEASKLLKINPMMYEESNPVGIKEVLKQMGICENYCRLPLLPASEPLTKKIAEKLKELI